MPREIRIAIEIEKRNSSIPIEIQLTEADAPVPVYTDPRGEPTTDWISVDSNGGMFYVAKGGDYKAHFKWMASDGKERTFWEGLTVEHPPICKGCSEHVPSVNDDGKCEDCGK